MKPGASPEPSVAPARMPFPFRLWAAVAIMCLLAFSAHWRDYRINFTPSEPLGLWRIYPLDRPVAVGDLVFICPRPSAETQDAKARGYFRPGPCQGDYAPLIKRVVAVAGQRVDVESAVTIDGQTLAFSDLCPVDGMGRRLRPAASGTVPTGSVFVHSSFPGSFDSRYFGPLPVEGILGLAEEILTYAP